MLNRISVGSFYNKPRYFKSPRPDDRCLNRLTGLLVMALAAIGFLSPAEAMAKNADVVTQGTTVAVLFLVGTLVMKITAIVIGYLIVRLGHDTLIRGITGSLDFGITGSGVKAKLKSASPGAAFVLAGAAIIIWALAVEKPFDLQVGPSTIQSGGPAATAGGTIRKGPDLPD